MRQRVYAGELADGLGNLVSRPTALCERSGVPELSAGASGSGRDLAPPEKAAQALEECRFDRALDALWGEALRINREISEVRPWQEYPDAGSNREVLGRWLSELDGVARWLGAFLPDTASRIRQLLSRPVARKAPPLFPKRT